MPHAQHLNTLARSVGSARDKDPTRTLTLRRRFSQDATRRLVGLKGRINKLIIEDDFLGSGTIDRNVPGARVRVLAPFAHVYDPRKATEFMTWLEAQHTDGILEIVRTGPGGPTPWSNVYITTAYDRGLSNADTLLAREGVNMGGIRGSFHMPFHADRVANVYTKVFTQLKGITETMDSQISKELALGMATGQGPEAIARRLTNRVDKIGITRARLIARTEVVLSHNLAGLNEYARLESIIGKEIKVLWWTALDERVRSIHVSRHGNIYSRAQASTLLGEPNCRCALLPEVT